MEEIFPKESGWGQTGGEKKIGQYLQSEGSYTHGTNGILELI